MDKLNIGSIPKLIDCRYPINKNFQILKIRKIQNGRDTVNRLLLSDAIFAYANVTIDNGDDLAAMQLLQIDSYEIHQHPEVGPIIKIIKFTAKEIHLYLVFGVHSSLSGLWCS